MCSRECLNRSPVREQTRDRTARVSDRRSVTALSKAMAARSVPRAMVRDAEADSLWTCRSQRMADRMDEDRQITERGRRVLVVEDEPRLREMLQRAVLGMEFDVVLAPNAETAVSL